MSRKKRGRIADVSALMPGELGAAVDRQNRAKLESRRSAAGIGYEDTRDHPGLPFQPKPVDTIQLPSGLQVPASTSFLGGDFPLTPAAAAGVAAVAEPEYVTYEVHCPRCRQLWYRLLQIQTADQGGAVCGTCRGKLSLRRHVTSTQGLNSGFDIESRRKRTDQYRG